MRWLALIGLVGLLGGCDPRPAGVITLDEVREALVARGEVVTEGAGGLAFQHAAAGRTYGVAVTLTEAPPALRLQTTGLFTLREAKSDGAVVRLLTLLATVNAELWGASAALDGATGEVSVRVEAGLEPEAVARAWERLLSTADALLPRLQAAVAAP